MNRFLYSFSGPIPPLQILSFLNNIRCKALTIFQCGETLNFIKYYSDRCRIGYGLPASSVASIPIILNPLV